jgi:hypothetical protein
MTEQDKALLELAKKATPGPWGKMGWSVYDSVANIIHVGSHWGNKFATQQIDDNAAFIAAIDPGTVVELLERKEEFTERITASLLLAVQYGGIDGAHHKTWVIDQMVRILTGDQYEKFVAEACDGKNGPHTYKWDCGIAP